MDLSDPKPLGRRAFLGWVARAGAAVAALLGTSVGYAPRAFALHNVDECLGGQKYYVGDPCSVTGALGPCVNPGQYSCTDVCSGHVVCLTNRYNRRARILCTCHDKKCCLVPC